MVVAPAFQTWLQATATEFKAPARPVWRSDRVHRCAGSSASATARRRAPRRWRTVQALQVDGVRQVARRLGRGPSIQLFEDRVGDAVLPDADGLETLVGDGAFQRSAAAMPGLRSSHVAGVLVAKATDARGLLATPDCCAGGAETASDVGLTDIDVFLGCYRNSIGGIGRDAVPCTQLGVDGVVPSGVDDPAGAARGDDAVVLESWRAVLSILQVVRMSPQESMTR